MIITVLLDILVRLLFLLSGVFFLLTLPVELGIAVCIPLLAMYMMYLKLDRLESSMSETRREIDTFRSDHQALVKGMFLALFVAGAAILFVSTKDIRLLPVNETREAVRSLGNLEKLGQLDKLATIESSLAETNKKLKVVNTELKNISAAQGRVVELLRLPQAPTDTDKQVLSTLKELNKVLGDIKGLLSRIERDKP